MEKSSVDKLLINLGLNNYNIDVIIPNEINDIFSKADDWLKCLNKLILKTKLLLHLFPHS